MTRVTAPADTAFARPSTLVDVAIFALRDDALRHGRDVDPAERSLDLPASWLGRGRGAAQ